MEGRNPNNKKISDKKSEKKEQIEKKELNPTPKDVAKHIFITVIITIVIVLIALLYYYFAISSTN